MKHVELSQWLPYTPQQIYEYLTDPSSLVRVVGRIQAAEVIEREGDQGKLSVRLDMPARKTVDTIGEVNGVPYEKMQFATHDPFPLEFTWELSPENEGTNILGRLGFDLSSFGLPMPGRLVQGIVKGELLEDMERLESALAEKYG